MIPKVIHYCWFGGNPLPKSAQKCIASWKKYLPDYEIKEWNESNFDVNIIPYTAEAYKAKKYAFVSDYARFWILYKYGGLYFDTDVEVIKNMDDIIAKGPFMGCENEAKPGATPAQLGVAPGLGLGVNPGLGLGVNPGLGLGVNPGLGLGVNPGLGLYGEILEDYKTSHFITANGELDLKTIVDRTTEVLCKYGLQNTSKIQEVAGVLIYPKEYFCPKDYFSGKLNVTSNSYCIHWYGASWVPKSRKLKNKLKQNYIIKKIINFIK